MASSVVRDRPRGSSCVTWREVLEDVPAAEDVKEAIGLELENTARFCGWNLSHVPALQRPRRSLGYAELEGALHEGHPYHPCFKARTGFSLSDHAAYGPEAGGSFALRWLAVRRSALRQALPGPEHDFYRAELGDDHCLALTSRRQRAGARASDYGFVPVHPWQWRRLEAMPSVTAALGRGELIDLELELGCYRATQALRTLMPAGDARAAHLKLPLAVRISSSLRTFQQETVRAAPAVSRWLQRLVEGDAFFAEVAGLTLLAEYASVSYAPAAAAKDLEGHLGAIWREPIERHLESNEAAVPFNTLFACESDGRPFIEAWVERHGLVDWLSRLLIVSVLPVWRLLVHHGIALEAHAQNMILVHRDGEPVRIALRDFHDSLEFVPDYLAAPALSPDFAALDERFRHAPLGRYYAMPCVEELRQLFMDSVFVFNLSELSWMLDRHYGFRERDFWRLARKVLDSYGRSGWSSAEREARLELRAAFVQTESLFTARLSGSADAVARHVVPSSLCESAEEETHARRQ